MKVPGQLVLRVAKQFSLSRSLLRDRVILAELSMGSVDAVLEVVLKHAHDVQCHHRRPRHHRQHSLNGVTNRHSSSAGSSAQTPLAQIASALCVMARVAIFVVKHHWIGLLRAPMMFWIAPHVQPSALMKATVVKIMRSDRIS